MIITDRTLYVNTQAAFAQAFSGGHGFSDGHVVQSSDMTVSVINNRNRDCVACRLVSGAGLIGAGLYVSHHSKRFTKTTGKTIMFSIASALVILGSTRILDLPPFRNQFSHD
ncbi:uncharacterized protein [Venturia canescens]|uniref:uncharacterized protein n=1 Tax=Venturia canescens TaxID=32260 RepID=UPI001C9C809F|nr:uncharacterized protein LOC122409661 [Venturia canescens]